MCTGTDCEPEVFVSEPGREITSLVGEGNSLYYTVCTTSLFSLDYHCDVKRVRKNTGAVTTLVTDEGRITGGLAVDGNHVYFAGQCVAGGGCKIRRVNENNGNTITLVNDDVFADSVDMQVQGNWLYISGSNLGREPVIQRIRKNGSGALETIVANDADMGALANYPSGFIEVDGQNVFYTSSKTKRVAKAGGVAVTLFDSEPMGDLIFGNTSLAKDRRYVYTEVGGTSSAKGGIWRTPLGGGTSTQLFAQPFTEATPATGVAADGNGNVVWTSEVSELPGIFTRAVKMYVGATGQVVELGRGIRTEISGIPFYERTVTDGKAVYFAINKPITNAELDAICAVNPNCPLDFAIYTVDTCRP